MGIFSKKLSVRKFVKEQNLPAIIELLDNEDIKIKKEAILALGQIGDETCLPPLFKIINEQGFMTTEKIALLGDVAWALGEIGDKKAKPSLKFLQELKPGTSIGGGSFEEMMRQAAELKETVDAVKQKANEALKKIG
ncbi:MAG: HEAT repeat domain-containing protein [Anaerolineaceae bacterium]|nr:HEAT repeat domain-containing protein [Anaerolineaceae bacterium]